MTVEFDTFMRPTAEQLNALPKGVIARGKRESNSSTTTTEVGVLRLDDVPIKAGRLYVVYTGNIAADGSANNNNIGARLRHTTDGSTPTTSSTLLQAGNYDQQSAAASESANTILASRAPTVDETWSVLLTAAAFIGAPTVSIFASSTQPLELFIEDKGIDPTDTGVDV